MRGEEAGAPVLETAERLLAYGLWGIAGAAVLFGLFTLLFRTPAKATVIFDAAKSASVNARAAIISNGVHTTEIPAYPFLVEDLVQFSTRAGEDIRLTLRRRFRSDPPSLVWYSAANPRRVIAINPLRCFAFACGCGITALWLRW
jgi:hypothetical protein